jgi:dTDP-4-dehydrorhamnose reductase
MKILVTGYNGFLGRNLIKSLNRKKYNVFFVGRKKIDSENFYKCDFKNLVTLGKILNKIKPDIIINLVAFVNFSKKPPLMLKINALVPRFFSTYCKKNKKYLIQSSGTLVHGESEFYSIKTKLNPKNYYGVSKLKADKFIIKSKCDSCIIRFPGIYGKDGPEHLGINKFINYKLLNKKITFNGNVHSKRNYIYVDDAVKILIKCIRDRLKGIFYVGGEIKTFNQMILLLNKYLPNKDNIIIIDNKEIIKNQIVRRTKSFLYTSFVSSIKKIL